MTDVRPVPFDRAHAATVLSWARSAEEREAWAAIRDEGVGEPIFERWHAEDGVHAFSFVTGDEVEHTRRARGASRYNAISPPFVGVKPQASR